ncbi:hypothetical protein CSC34_3923 [Pseudomonas aeruginosa]|nr:hypothetical protein CSC34_3923 [Pseudomonas aeruginosa]
MWVLGAVNNALPTTAQLTRELINRTFAVLHHALLLRRGFVRAHLYQSVKKIPAILLSSPWRGVDQSSSSPVNQRRMRRLLLQRSWRR